ncbi:ABC transporter substrate-binding protein [Pseudactinotalea sp. HY158]|uniref:ABC transporter substrate-binding protein n=1 Tax=Pseudactinotalea sp. HY158 TaxID=2654547 RepID=UPI001891F894|nr:ABC transporter substrate-binding protein [Pseudactinotalea sp. HY158]
MKTKGRRATLMVVVALAASACGGVPESDPVADRTAAARGPSALLPDDVREDGVIHWGVEPYFPPFTMSGDDDQTVVGINVDLADELSAVLGVESDVIPGSFDGLIPGIQSERYDIGIATMADTAERREQVDFIDYFENGSGIFVRIDSPLGIEHLADLCGHVVGVVKGTYQVGDAEDQADRCADDGLGQLEVQVFNEQAAMILALTSGRTEAMLMEDVAGLYAATAAGSEFEITGEVQDPKRSGMIVSKDRPELRAAVQAAMQQLMDRGRYLEILESWGQEGGAIGVATLNDAR